MTFDDPQRPHLGGRPCFLTLPTLALPNPVIHLQGTPKLVFWLRNSDGSFSEHSHPCQLPALSQTLEGYYLNPEHWLEKTFGWVAAPQGRPLGRPQELRLADLDLGKLL